MQGKLGLGWGRRASGEAARSQTYRVQGLAERRTNVAVLSLRFAEGALAPAHTGPVVRNPWRQRVVDGRFPETLRICGDRDGGGSPAWVVRHGGGR